jgi:transcriptional regulator with XRE-family HTH domain
LSDRGIRGIYPTTVAKIEAGDRAVRIDELTSIADLFGVSLDRLLGRRETSSARQNIEFVVGNLFHTARSGISQVQLTEHLLRAVIEDLAVLDFDQRDELVALATSAKAALSHAIEELGGLVESSQELGMARDRARVRRGYRRQLMEERRAGDDEAQS